MEAKHHHYKDSFLVLKVDTNLHHTNVDFLWEEIRTVGPHPTRRSYHSAVMWNNKMIVSGGQDLREGPQRGIWAIEFNEGLREFWEELKVPEIGPLCRHTSIVYQDHLYIFGGTDNVDEYNTTWIVNLNDLSTRRLDPESSDLPPPVDSHSANLYETAEGAYMIVYGGFKASERTSDVYLLNLSTLQWRKVDTNEGPEPRSSHSAIIYKDHLYIFGGSNDEGEKICDFWKLNLVNFRWERIPPNKQAPSGRSGQSVILYKDTMVMFGGMKDISRETNEMFSYNFVTETWAMFQIEQQIKDPVSAAQLEEFKNSKSPQRRHTLNVGIVHKKNEGKESSPTLPRQLLKKKTLYDGPSSPVQGRIKGNTPHQRDGHSAVVSGDFMYVFGGDRHQMPFSDIYAYRLVEENVNTPLPLELNSS